jgi:hypothetical protein
MLSTKITRDSAHHQPFTEQQSPKMEPKHVLPSLLEPQEPSVEILLEPAVAGDAAADDDSA